MLSLGIMKIGQKIFRTESCASTNDAAQNMALQGEEEGTVVLCEEQTAGRGTKGRKWYSARGKGLYLSIILRPRQRDLSLLPLTAGLAVRDALIESVNVFIQLKWPNDLIYEQKKLGGILCEGSFMGNELSHVILGIGLNVSHRREDFPEEFRSQAVSLKLAIKREVNKEALLSKLWEMLDFWYRDFLKGEKRQIMKAYEEFSVFSLGERIEVETEKEHIKGEYKGIDLRGQLLVRTQEKQRSLLAAEVIQVRGRSKEG